MNRCWTGNKICQKRLHEPITAFSVTEQLTSGSGEEDDVAQLDFGKISDMATHDVLRSKTREM